LCAQRAQCWEASVSDIVDWLRVVSDSYGMGRCEEALEEIERLRAGGCARGQKTTQWCAEASDAQARIAALEEALKHYACTCGPHQCEAGGDYQDVTCGHAARAALTPEGT
jgi:hypothetical protein